MADEKTKRTRGTVGNAALPAHYGRLAHHIVGELPDGDDDAMAVLDEVKRILLEERAMRASRS